VRLALLVLDGSRRQPEHLGDQHQQRERDAGPQHELPDLADRLGVAQDRDGRSEQADLLLVARPAVLVEQLLDAAGLPGVVQQGGHRLVAAFSLT
jgi:hypothetical protein